MKFLQELKTERLLLRAWVPEDAPDLYAIASNPNIGPAAGWPPHKSVLESENIIRTVLGVPGTYAVVLRETVTEANPRGTPIGSIGLMTRDNANLKLSGDELELGYWVAVPYWGNGYIPEAARALIRHAFEDLDVSRIWAGYYEGNNKSARVQEKLGFEYRYTLEDEPVPQLGDMRTEIIQVLTNPAFEI